MVKDRGIDWADSADRHGFTLDDVLYAARHVLRKKTYAKKGETYLKLTGGHHGDPLVPSLEVEMKIDHAGELRVFHVNAEQDGFFDRDQVRRVTMVNNNEWQWDESQAVESSGEQAQAEMDALLMKAAGTDDPDEAVSVLLGRPRVGEKREETVKIQVRVPQSWQREIDRKAAGRHLSRSQYLRQLIGHDTRQMTA
jgi:hypothetical protein